ncbi:MAG TPA: aminoacyl-tRNA hydrolase [Bacteroidia bacterium]|nr:aminoacyl-tRNA hydrolase [Bacteroidia bacterium]
MSHKQILVWRKDLNCRKGKIAAQCAHASVAAILSVAKRSQWDNGEELISKTLTIDLMDKRLDEWLTGNFKKVCVYVESEEELLALHQKAKDAGLITALITDSGLTEFHGVPTNTCIAVGPDFEDKVDAITGHLKLL